VRSTGSTVSQLFDSIVLGIAFWMTGKDYKVFSICTGYFVKLIIAIALTPNLFGTFYNRKILAQ
jgi:uncharacterized PurR-regulated membrane protein YhhQ (DUF165 family)